MSASAERDDKTMRHSVWEDAQGLSIGVFACALGVVFLAHLGFLTGQTAGLALLLSYTLDISFGVAFFAVNLPFYWFAYKRLGLEFTIKSALCVTALSVVVELIKPAVQFDHLDPLLGVLAFGTLAGFGILAIIRHQGSLGGLGAVSLMVQDATGFRAGYVQQITDALIFAAALFFFPWQVVAWSVAGSIILNGIIAFNHRRDRYIAR